MMNTRSRFPRILFALVFLLAAPCALGEIGVVVDFDQDRVFGPYSIIDDADPIGGKVWDRHTFPTASRVVLNENGAANGDGRPATALNTTSGLPLVAWGKKNGNDFDIVVSRFQQGAWSAPEVIASAVTSSIDPEPQVIVDNQDGSVHIVYFVSDTTPSVYHRQAPADLSSWSAAVEVSQLGEKALRPSAAIHEGVLRVAYESHGFTVGSTPRQIVVASSDGAGGFTYEVVANSHHADPNWPQLHASGPSLWLDWVDGNTDMGWSIWQPVSGWDPVQVETFNDLSDREFHVRRRIRGMANF